MDSPQLLAYRLERVPCEFTQVNVDLDLIMCFPRASGLYVRSEVSKADGIMEHTYFFPLLLFPLDKWIVDERIENRHETVAVLPEELERYLAGIPEHALDARDAEPIDNVLC